MKLVVAPPHEGEKREEEMERITVCGGIYMVVEVGGIGREMLLFRMQTGQTEKKIFNFIFLNPGLI